MKKLNYLLLTSAPNSRSSKRFVERLEKRKHKVTVIHPDDFYLFLSESKGHDQIYLKSSETRLFSKDFDRVIVRIGGSLYGRSVVRHLSMNMGKFCSTLVSGIERCSDKFRTAQLLSHHRIKVMKQVLTKEVSETNTGFLVDKIGGLPLVFKLLSGSQGIGVGLIDSEASAGTILESISHLQKTVILQRFVETKDNSDRASDIRVFIVDGEVVAAMKRYSKEKQFRSNFSISSMGEKYEPTEEQKELALDAAAVCKSLGVCGVDIMEDRDGVNYIVEVNSNPGLKIEEVTGINIVDKIIDFTERGKLSKESYQRYEKFDINAKVSRKGYVVTGKVVPTSTKNGPGRLHEISQVSTGVIHYFENSTNLIFIQQGDSFKKIDMIQ